MTVLAFVLSAVITIITDFDRNLVGFVKMSQKPLEDVVRDMDTMLQRKSNVPASPPP